MEQTKGRFNIIDLILLVVALLVIFAIVGKIAFPELFSTKGESAVVTCVFTADSNVSPFASGFEEGDKLYVNNTALLGTIAKTVKTVSEDGAAVNYEFTVIAELEKISGGYVTEDGTYIVPGESIRINSRDNLSFLFLESLEETPIED